MILDCTLTFLILHLSLRIWQIVLQVLLFHLFSHERILLALTTCLVVIILGFPLLSNIRLKKITEPGVELFLLLQMQKPSWVLLMVPSQSLFLLITPVTQPGVNVIALFWPGCLTQFLEIYSLAQCISRQQERYGLNCNIGFLKVMVLRFLS